MQATVHSIDVEEERKWAFICHLSGYSGIIIPFGNILVPVIIYAIMKDEYPLIKDQGKEIINFQISMTIYLVIAGLLCIILIGIPILLALVLLSIVLPLVGALRSKKGFRYRYPINLRIF